MDSPHGGNQQNTHTKESRRLEELHKYDVHVTPTQARRIPQNMKKHQQRPLAHTTSDT